MQSSTAEFFLKIFTFPVSEQNIRLAGNFQLESRAPTHSHILQMWLDQASASMALHEE